MSQVSYGTITITDTNDIESITVEYNRNQSSSNAPSATDTNWSTTRPDWAQGYYIWQRTRVHKSGTTEDKDVIGTAVCITGSTGSTGAPGRGLTDSTTQYCNYGTGEPANNYSGWTDAPPSYDSSKPNYWVMITNTYSAAPTSEIIKYKDEALTKAVADAAIANSIAQHANEDAQGAMSQSSAALQRVQAKYGTSSTAATTAAKVASCEGFQLFNGAEVFIKFTNKNNVANPTLNVNSTGAKSIRDSDGNALDAKFYWKDGSLVHFVYDGTYWRILDIVTTEKYNSLVSDINGISQTVGTKASQTDLTNLTERVSTNETNISQTATSITSLVSNQDTYTAPDGTTKTNTIKSAIKQNADNISLRVEKNGVIAAINASTESSGGSAVKISADKVNIEGAAIFTGNGRLSQNSLNNAYDSKGSASAAQTAAINAAAQDATNKANAAETAAKEAIPTNVSQLNNDSGYQNATQVNSAITTGVSGKADKTAAVAEEQYIYISKASGTTSVSGTTTWITETGDKQNTWTTKRPTYNTSYPVLFVAKQKKVVSGTVTCTTPVKDDTTTIIDGGHITTGTIDSNRLNANTIKVNAANIQGGLTIGQVDGLEKITTDLENSVYGVTTYVYEHQDASTSETISEIVYVDNSGTEPRYYYIEGDVEHEVNKSQLKTEVVDGETQLVTTITNITTDISAQLSDFNNSINSELATLNGTVNNYLGANGYINLATDGSEPCIIIGQGEFFVKITNKEMGFYQRPENTISIEEGVDGVTKVAWISSNELVISQSQIKDKQQIGNFVWEVRDANRISLKYNKITGENNE